MVDKEESGFSEYLEKSSFYANIPDNVFSQQFQIIHKPAKEINHEDLIVDEDIQLSSIKDSKTLILYQRDQRLLQRLYDMATRSEGVKRFFRTTVYGWRGEIKMTYALKGKERRLQSFLDIEDENDGFSFPKLKKSKKKQKKQIMDYMIPEDQGGIYE
ncbi:MAG TPA: hypothetical protein ENI36_03775 [Thermoplasmatales archaeon]|nr:hypothetical protein [Thermoplasmatales archaeon]